MQNLIFKGTGLIKKKKNVNKYKDYNTLNKEYATYVYGWGLCKTQLFKVCSQTESKLNCIVQKGSICFSLVLHIL